MRLKPGQFVLVLVAMLWGMAPIAWTADFAGPMGQPRPPELNNVSVSEHPGNPLPLDLTFMNEDGKPVELRQFFGSRPVVLQLGYYGCPMLCSLMSHGLVDAFKQVKLAPGKDFDIVFVSIDPSEAPKLAAQKKEAYLSEFGREGASGWHFLTGRQEAIEQLARADGFNYAWVQTAQQFAHPAVMTVCMPDGRISRYLYGVRFDPQTVRLSIVEASQGKAGNTLDQLFLTCFQYDGRQGRYAFTAMYIMRAGGVVIMAVVAFVLIRLFRREAKQRRGLAASAALKH